MPKNKPFLIAGPCSAESRSQVLDTAELLIKKVNISKFRAGVWKPRTRPGNFEGKGNPALLWLKEVQQKLNIEACTEVGLPKHIESCLQHGIRSFWIGTRTTSSPFAVSELGEALKGTNCSVMIKNPINPDINLWIGAVERLTMAGLKNISLIHRGFSTIEEKKYRYDPIWKIAKEMKKEFPKLPLISDPSHITGDVKYLKEVIEKAKSEELFDGYMIESHLNPSTALTDDKQQINPNDLADLFEWRFH